MTMKTLNDFATTVQGDETLARGLANAIGDRQGPEAAEAFAAYARAAGFDVNADEVEAASQAAAPQGALWDDQLDAVAGGGFFFDAASFVTRNALDVTITSLTSARDLITQNH
ncbi:Nif11-like leader peptide family RiPP precursor [Jiella marina]|uniref:Nif11-like leader peptide family RiPP precursor n=1 Tax=Jiella sp. LLJ827 TaxID=2917712 RepID=UPI00210152DF|nr:Nif11-like leader peptide family RiPP precursor [Jiella sp. LLJ827]MCQ0988071.1 Nif11-like leader peptide family RiPP precursor [Jiella sp. LLJ827]